MQTFRNFLSHADSRAGKLLLIGCLIFTAFGRVTLWPAKMIEKPFLIDGEEESESMRPWFRFFLSFMLLTGVFIIFMYNQNK